MTTENEIEVETPEQEVPEVSISGMIDKIVDGENTDAQADFEALISAKLSDALDAKRVEVAKSIYGSDEEVNDQYEDETDQENEDESKEDDQQAS